MYSNFYTPSIAGNLPPQMLNKSEKTEEWKKNNMDALESIGRSQFAGNLKLIENYEMVRGKFIFQHYLDQDEYTDMISQLTKEFALPSYLRHYDICSKIINTLSGEWQGRPDVFRVKSHDESTSGEFQRTQTDLLHKWVMAKINAEISRKLLEMGVDENAQDFNSPEEEQQYNDYIEQLKQQLTPPQVNEYMKTSWSAAAEKWGQHQLELDRQRFKFVEKEKKEFEDMLIADRCFRHFYLTATGYNQETWNPVNVFFHKSPDVDEVENGDYVGRVFYLTVSDIIDRYGYKMKKSELDRLQEEVKKKNKRWNYAPGTEYVFDNYLVPFKGYPGYEIMRNSPTYVAPNDSGVPYLDSGVLSSLTSGSFLSEKKGYCLVVEAYWKSQEKIGKVTYIDPETGKLTVKYVDEDVVLPKYFKNIDSTFEDSNEPNTVVWTWVNRTWKGVKICVKNNVDGFSEDIYLDISPLEFQLKGDNNIYGCKLPVCGQVFNNRNAQSSSLVDLVKTHQIGHNVAMNQAYAEMQKDYGKFIIMDVNMFPDKKDWGGDKAYEKFMIMAKELGMTIADTSPQNTNSAVGVAGGHYPKEVDLDASARILSRLKIAEAFEEFALKQIGFNQYRLGTQSDSASATGVKEGQSRSFAATESYFTNFSNYIQRCHEMNLNMAQYVQSQNKDVVITYVKSDLSRAFIKISGTDLLLSDLQVYVSNSQEQVRQLETLRQLALSNNTTNASIVDLAEIITDNSPASIKVKLKNAYDEQQRKLQDQFKLEEQKLQQQAQLEQLRQDREDARMDKQLESREKVAVITTFGRQDDNLKDTDSNATPDILELEKLGLAREDFAHKVAQESAKTQNDKNKTVAEQEYRMKKLDLDKQKIQADIEIQNKELEYAKIMKGKELEVKKKQAAKKPKSS